MLGQCIFYLNKAMLSNAKTFNLQADLLHIGSA